MLSIKCMDKANIESCTQIYMEALFLQQDRFLQIGGKDTPTLIDGEAIIMQSQLDKLGALHLNGKMNNIY